MDFDEFEPRKLPAKPKDLSVYSVFELQNYIEALKAEILRAEDTMKRKESHKDAASAIFKT